LGCVFPGYDAFEHVWDFVGRRLTRDPRAVASANELWVRIQTIWNALSQADIQNLFDSMPRCVAALIAARGGYTKYRFRSLVIVCFENLIIYLYHYHSTVYFKFHSIMTKPSWCCNFSQTGV